MVGPPVSELQRARRRIGQRGGRGVHVAVPVTSAMLDTGGTMAVAVPSMTVVPVTTGTLRHDRIGMPVDITTSVRCGGQEPDPNLPALSGAST